MPALKVENNSDSSYLLGNSDLEAKRVQLQSRLGFNKYTREFLESLGLPSGLTVLELGAGTGEVSGIMAEMGHSVVAVDADGGKLAQLTHNLKLSGLDGRVKTIQTDVMKLNLGDEQVDVVYGRLFWTHVPKYAQPEVLQRLLQYVKPEGLIIIEDLALSFEKTTWKLNPPSEAHKKMHTAFLAMYEKNHLDPDTGPNMTAILANLGLKEIVVKKPYTIDCAKDNPFINAYWMIYATAQKTIVKQGIMANDEFDTTLAEYKRDLMKEGTIATTPAMHQMVFQKPAGK